MVEPLDGRGRATNTAMQANYHAVVPPSATQSRPGERRKNPRFDMHVPVFFRGMGESWIVSETADVSAAGSYFVCHRPFLLSTPIEYVLTFPPELTKASRPLRVRFFGMVIRCEQVREGNGAFGVAVRNTSHRYLSRDEAASFDLIEQKPSNSESDTDSDRIGSARAKAPPR